MSIISALDWSVIVAIALLHILAMLYSHKKSIHEVAADVPLSRSFTLPMLVPALVVAWYGKLFMVTQIAFDNGVYNFYIQGVFWYIGYIIFAFYLVKRIRAYNANTLPELISKMYGEKSKAVTAVLVFIKALPITYVISLSMVLQMFMSVSFATMGYIIFFGLFLHIMINGMRSLVYSNVIHFVCMLASIGLVLIFSIQKFGGTSFLYAHLPTTYFQPRGAYSIINMLAWLGVAFSTTFISPVLYQYCLAAKSDRTASIGILLATGFWILLDIGTTIGAMYAKAVMPNSIDSVYAYSVYALQLLPNGLRGLFVTGLLSSIIPGMSVALSIASTTIYYDFLNIKSLYYAKLRYIAIAGTMVCLLISVVAFNAKFAAAWNVLKWYFTGCLLMPILTGYFYPKLINTKVFSLSVVISFSIITLWHLCSMQNLTNIEPMYAGCIASLFVVITHYCYSRLHMRYQVVSH